jgi:signal transduction histidine kinase/CheY-like chemotaxis protein
MRAPDTDIDPAQLEDDLDATGVTRLRSAITAMLVWGCVMVVVDVVFFPVLRLQTLVLHGAMFAVAVPLRLRLRRDTVRRTDMYGMLVLAVRMAHLGLAYYRTGSFFYQLLLINGMLAGSGILVRGRWVAVCLAFGTMAWLPGLLRVQSDQLVLGLTLVSGVCLVGTLVHRSRSADFYRTHALLVRDRRRGAELAAALAAAERELTDRKRVEAERERLRDQLSHAHKMEAVGTLAGGFAHDINNMLGAVMGLAEMIKEGTEGQLREDAQHILTSCQRGSELTRNLLGFSRRGQYRLERIDLGAIADDVVKLLCRTIPKGVTLDLHAEPDAHVVGDSTQLGQSLMNLCLNSVDAVAGQGTLTVRVSRAYLDAEAAARTGAAAAGPHIALSVTDSGCGMDQETCRRMFEPFFTTRKERGGTGLGLAMVYGTTMKQGGGLEVDTAPGAGTRITLFLPAAPPREKAATEPVAADAESAAGASATTAKPRGGILIVDDEPMVRAVMRRTLQRAGYTVREAVDGADGVAQFESWRDHIDIVLLDMAMPVMNGAACFARLRELEPGVRVLLVSGFTAEADAQTCLRNGALGFLEKPFTSAALLAAVARAIAPARDAVPSAALA